MKTKIEIVIEEITLKKAEQYRNKSAGEVIDHTKKAEQYRNKSAGEVIDHTKKAEQ